MKSFVKIHGADPDRPRLEGRSWYIRAKSWISRICRLCKGLPETASWRTMPLTDEDCLFRTMERFGVPVAADI